MAVADVGTERSKVHGDERTRDVEHAKDAFPPHGLERVHVVARKKLFLNHHLHRDYDLRAHDKGSGFRVQGLGFRV